jgi:Glycosyl hydrolases family 32 N-terminal domain.
MLLIIVGIVFRNNLCACVPLCIVGGILSVLSFPVFLNGNLSVNKSRINKSLDIEFNKITNNKNHSAFTDMVKFNDTYVLAHTYSPVHIGNEKSYIVVLASTDFKTWKKVKIFHTNEDIRDPKLQIINGKLCLYALLNVELQPRPHTTMVYTTTDLSNWSDGKKLEDGWLMWRPRTYDNMTWYCPAYWHKFEKIDFI